jgi:serine protease Do
MLKNIVIFFLLTVLLNQSAIAAVLPDFAVMAKENADAVVAISVSQKQAEPGMELQTPENTGSYGSGFVISEDGYILTNYHVIGAEPDQIMVRFKNHHIEMATLVGFDKVIDIALLKVNIPALQKVSLGSVASLDVGEWVMAIGAPFGFEQTVTKGIVSAKDRIMSNEVYVPYIQTDAATNHGNSGGPLFNARGQVVGINALIYSKTEGYQGLSFAIPIDLAMNAVAQLKSKGKVSRG